LTQFFEGFPDLGGAYEPGGQGFGQGVRGGGGVGRPAILALRADVERDTEVALLEADFLHGDPAGEARLVLVGLVGADDVLDVVVGEEAQAIRARAY